jgi:hypothetical protein
MTERVTATVEQELRDAVERRRDELVELTRELVRRRSTLGSEGPAQKLVEERLRSIGFDVERVQPDADAALSDPYAGYPFLSYEGRSSVAARLPEEAAAGRCTSPDTSTSSPSSGRTSGSTSRGPARSRTAGSGAAARAT